MNGSNYSSPARYRFSLGTESIYIGLSLSVHEFATGFWGRRMSYTPLLVGAGAGGFAWIVRTNDGWKDWWSGWALAAALCFLAYLTNPNPTSFRTHVTSQSFHNHLERLSSSTSPTRSNSSASTRSSNSNGTDACGQSNASNSSGPTPGHKRGKNGGSGTGKNSPNSTSTIPSDSDSPAPSHVFSFSNRISLAVRTPSYKFTSYHFFSTVFVPSSRSTTSRPQSPHPPSRNSELNALLGFGGELWLGVFGRWYALKWWEGEEVERDEKRGRLERGVRVVSVQDDFRDSRPSSSNAPYTSSPLTQGPRTPLSPRDRDSASATPPHSPSSASSAAANSSISGASRSAPVSKRIFRAGQRRSSPTSLTRLKSKAENAARERDEAAERAASLDGSNKISPPHASSSPRGGNPSDSKSSSPAQYDAPSSTSTLATSDPGRNHPPPDPILVELQLQLSELRSQTRESEKRLQDELEVLRGKKKDEDAFRAELKVKTKGLEEAKRAADASRTEAEKELNERKSVVKEVQKRVEKLRGEISKLEKKEMEQVERKEKKKRERKEREKKLAEDVSRKKDELKEREQGLEEVLQKVNEMEKKLDVRRELLASRRNELAQLAGLVAARNGLGGVGPPIYALPPQQQQVTTATFGGVGAVANAFAVPFGHGAYGRRNYPYVHPLSATSSRPTSIRSGHYDPHTGTFQSAPSSPTLSHPVSPLDDSSAYPNSMQAEQDGGWPSSYPAATSSSSGAPTLPQTGFLEHRLQHRATNSLPSAEDVPSHFLPFDLDQSTTPSSSSTAQLDDGTGKPRTLALPMQYLDSGLLAGSQSPGVDGPLSPMTPHQASLIPSQLFNMLDDDDNDDFVMPDSPTLRSHFGSMSDWKGLGLDVNEPVSLEREGTPGPSRRESEERKQREEQEGEEEFREDEFHEVDNGGAGGGGEQLQSSFLTLRPDLFQSSGTYSATTSPLGPPPGSPFGPWDMTPSSSPALASMPPPVPSDSIGVIGANILHRLSPSQDLSDDLPRAGLSLNPDAKAFAFPFVQQHSRTASVPSPSVLGGGVGGAAGSQLVRNGRCSSSVMNGDNSSAGGTSSALPSPTSATYPSPISPPAKSRMEFANVVSTSTAPLSARFTPPFDWPRSTSSPKTTSASSPSIVGEGGDKASPGGVGFNPFDEEDSLLGFKQQ